RATSDRVLFGSELKALRSMPGWTPEMDRVALADYLERGYIPHPRTIYRDVRKLAPGTILKIAPEREPLAIRYWDLKTVAGAGIAAARHHDQPAHAAVDALENLLRDAVKRRMIADVPLG